jgi:hypothetical protein
MAISKQIPAFDDKAFFAHLALFFLFSQENPDTVGLGFRRRF